VLACIGEQFDEGDEVCGVCVNIRAGKDRLELWSKTAANEAVQVGAGPGEGRAGLTWKN
jgi:translation initiation factor 4E